MYGEDFVTLIAAFREEQTPILLGDFLVTSNGDEAGTRKKICRISPNLAVGWAGSLIAATTVISEMRRRFDGARLSHRELHNFLVTYDEGNLKGLARVNLIGW